VESRAGYESDRSGKKVSKCERGIRVDISGIIKQLAEEADKAEDKIMEVITKIDMNYYDGDGDRLQRAIEILGKVTP
jgi:hypothetical protein